MKVYKVIPCGCNPCCAKDLEGVIALQEIALVGDKIIIEIVEMTQKEFDSLTEYEGP